MNNKPVPSLLLIGLLGVVPPVQAVDMDEVDTRYWSCRFCPVPSGLTGKVEAGAGTVTDDSAQFGAHNGLEDAGPYGIAAADLTWYGEDDLRWDLQASDLGLDTRSLTLLGGRQGYYKVHLSYDEMVHLKGGDATTPYIGAGTDTLTLPGDWARGATTGQMSALDASLKPASLGTDRQRLNIGALLQANSRWSFHWDVRHEEREGSRISGGSFIVNSVQFPEPIDDTTFIVRTGADYQGEGWQLGLNYTGSFYDNQDSSLTWDNPYSSLMAGDDRGQKALAPDNQFHQLTLQGNYRFSPRAVLAGNIAAGRMRQNEDLLAPSVNSALTQPTLPEQQADAQVNTLVANARLSWTPSIAGLSSTLRYRGELRDNNTPRETFTQVVTETYVGSDARNNPLSFSRHELEGQLRYRLSSGQRLTGAAEIEDYHRDDATDANTREYTLWGEVRSDLTERSEVQLKVTRSWRNGVDTVPGVISGSPQDAQMTGFDITDRIQNRIHAALNLFPTERVSTTVSADFRVSDYDDSVPGRTEHTQRSLGLDLSTTPVEDVSLYLYYARQAETYDQRNRASTGTTWEGKSEDTFNTFGAGGRIRNIRDKIDLSADIVLSDSLGQVDVETGSPGFPDVEFQRLSINLRGDYRFSENTEMGLRLAYENLLKYRDWHLDHVEPATAPKLLSLGRGTGEYELFVAALVGRYRF